MAVVTAAPMKAKDLKERIGWGGPDPLAPVAEYLTPAWVAEPKLDGCRASLELRADRSRFAGLRSSSFPALAGIAIPELAGTVLDGEFLAPLLPGYARPLLKQSSALFASGPAAAAKWLRYGPARLVVFDVTAIAGTDVTGLPYDQRRSLLAEIVTRITGAYPGCGVELIGQLPATAAAITALIDAGGEGVMLKRRTGRYTPSVRGSRSGDWLKIKAMATVDCWLTGGYRAGTGHRTGAVGSVEVAVTGGDGAALVVGHVAVKPAWVGEVTAADGSLLPGMAGTVIEVMTQGVNGNGLMRHPHMICLRPGKLPADCGEAQMSQLARV